MRGKCMYDCKGECNHQRWIREGEAQAYLKKELEIRDKLINKLLRKEVKEEKVYKQDFDL